MRLVTFSHAGSQLEHCGALDGDRIACLTEAGVAASVMDIILGGGSKLQEANAAMASAPRHALSGVKLHAPVRPGKVLCSGINYKGHAEENPNAKMPTEPFFFAKLPSSVVGPDARVAKPVQTQQMDYEVEFSAVIGTRLFKAAPGDVMDAIFGYTLVNDLSARDVQFKDNQITLGKNFAGFAPLGPCIVTKDALPNPERTRLRTRVNGVMLQDGTTADWIFPLPALLSYLSAVMPLEPGDVVTTGTPAGVGVFRNPQIFLKDGDVVEIEADGIGTLITHIADLD